jgi:hypothetical protein
MKKFFLIVFILLDLIIIAASVLFLIARMQTTSGTMMIGGHAVPMTIPIPMKPVTPPTASAVPTTATTPAPPAATPATFPVGTSRKILFSYKNAKARKVQIRADFTGWRAEPMQKDANNVWHYTAALEPGEYAYCFSVDDKSIKDPANKRTKQVGKTFVSAIVVQASAPPPHH